MRTYWTAHRLAMRGHDVHVVTNAKEAAPPFRMYMRREDWQRCEGVYESGRVTVHWTDPVDRSQSYLPMASPFVTKLATVAAGVHASHPFDVIYSHYLEPYGVAGYLASQMTGVPQVVRMAGSDAGRLWHHPQFERLYDHVLKSAAVLIAGGTVAERAVARGVDPARVAFGGGYTVPEDLFAPEGPRIDLDALRREVEADPDLRGQVWGTFPADQPLFGIYGKLGDNKGSFALLAALHRLKRSGVHAGLVALAHGKPEVEARFRTRAEELGLVDRILQIPYVPHWRVPEFLRSCLAVCCLEQDFPIGIHSPIVPREVLLCGTCLVGSTEVIRKLPDHERIASGYDCVAIEDVNDLDALSGRLGAIACDPQPTKVVGARGREFARELQNDIRFIEPLERVLRSAASRRRVPARLRALVDTGDVEEAQTHFPLTQVVAEAMKAAVGEAKAGQPATGLRPIDLDSARELLMAIERRSVDVNGRLASMASAVRIEIAIAEAEREPAAPGYADPLFRLWLKRWALDEHGVAGLVPIRDPQLRIIAFDFDVAGFLGARSTAQFPSVARGAPSYLAVFRRSREEQSEPLIIDRLTAHILELCDGTRTVAEIANQIDRGEGANKLNCEWIEALFRRRLIGLREFARADIA